MSKILTDCMSHSKGIAVYTWFKYFYPNEVILLDALAHANKTGQDLDHQRARRKVEGWCNQYRMNMVVNDETGYLEDIKWTDELLIKEIDRRILQATMMPRNNDWFAFEYNAIILALHRKPVDIIEQYSVMWDKIQLLSALGDDSALEHIQATKHFAFDEAAVCAASSDVDLIELNTILGKTDTGVIELLQTLSAKMIFAKFVEKQRGKTKVQQKPKGHPSPQRGLRRQYGYN